MSSLSNMIAFGALAAALLAPPDLSFSAGKFTVKDGTTITSVAIPSHKVSRFEPLLKASFRKDDRFVVWDSRGLVVRVGQSSKPMALEAWCTSPKLFDKPQIQRNRMALELGGYDSKVAKLLAARRIGAKVFLVVGWQDPHGRPWFQCLGVVNLDAPTPAVTPIARLRGQFLADPEAEPLPIVSGKIRVLWSDLDAWGECTVDPAGKAEVKTYGGKLVSFSWTSANTISFIEESSAGQTVLGRCFLPSGSRRTLVEVDTATRLIDSKSPWIAVVSEGDKLWVQNLDAASKVQVDPTSRAVRCGKFVIVWVGGAKPTSAVLYETSRWQKVADWKDPK